MKKVNITITNKKRYTITIVVYKQNSNHKCQTPAEVLITLIHNLLLSKYL